LPCSRARWRSRRETAARARRRLECLFSRFFNDTATTEIYTLSLHDALPISRPTSICSFQQMALHRSRRICSRSEEHTSELQSHLNLVCRLLLEKKTILTDNLSMRTAAITVEGYTVGPHAR